ncbi:SDR family oxidoreductase [Oceanobacillus sp. FSL W7-1309]|uniref:SDR family oxidoreductase n=1 Tax=Oceanobacillus sp. FSL W7-1309 TaxID=2954539 RepID=UPI000BA665FB|nr:SDR family oxidoreductase [Oceanobacillus sp.]PAE29248.1 oxidoreductase [Paenibacillus sp. 7884-2]
MNMPNQIAIVTGVSHKHGIGAATCLELAKAGVDLFFTYWQSDSGWPETFQREIQELGVKCAHAEIDLSEPEAYLQVIQGAENALGVPSILVNNAAYSTRDGYEKLQVAEMDAHYAVNIRAAMMLSAAFAKSFKKAGYHAGSIINLTSGQAQGPMVEELAYVATKGAISAFTLSLSAELGSLGITVNAVNPGPTNTGWMSEELKQALLPKFILGRIGEAKDAARLIAFLASKEAAWITGQVINSEGGFLRQ